MGAAVRAECRADVARGATPASAIEGDRATVVAAAKAKEPAGTLENKRQNKQQNRSEPCQTTF